MTDMDDQLMIIIIIIQHLYSAIMSYADTEALDGLHWLDIMDVTDMDDQLV